MIETALGVQNVFDIAKLSKRVDAITIGGQDLTADMNIESTKEATGIDFAAQTNCYGRQSKWHRCY